MKSLYNKLFYIKNIIILFGFFSTTALAEQNELIVTCVKHAIRVGYEDASCAAN